MTSVPLSAPQGAPPSLLRANLICMGSMALWAIGLPAADLIIPLIAGEQLAALRMSLAALFLLPLWLWRDGWQRLARADWLRGIRVGSFIGLGAWLIILGQAKAGAVTAAVISASMPVVGIGIEVLLDGRRLNGALIAGMALAVIGGIVALDLSQASGGFGLGVLLCFLSITAFVLGSRETVKGFPDLSDVGRAAITVCGSAISLLVLALGFWVAEAAPTPSLAAWGLRELAALLIFALLSLALSQVLWIRSVERLGVGMASLHINASPFYVMVLLFMMGSGWSWRQALGAAIVGLGVVVAQGLLRPRKAAAA